MNIARCDQRDIKETEIDEDGTRAPHFLQLRDELGIGRRRVILVFVLHAKELDERDHERSVRGGEVLECILFSELPLQNRHVDGHLPTLRTSGAPRYHPQG